MPSKDCMDSFLEKVAKSNITSNDGTKIEVNSTLVVVGRSNYDK